MSDGQNISCSQSRGAKPDTSFENSNFIANGFLKVPIKLLSRDLLINIVDLLLVHIGEGKDSYTGSEKADDITESQHRHSYNVLEAQSCGGIPTKSNYLKQNVRICSFCRTKHELGYHNCPAYGNRCQFCGRYNHDQRACWFKYPNFCRFKIEIADQQRLGTERNLNGDIVATEMKVEAQEQKSNNGLKETPYNNQLKETGDPSEREDLCSEELKETLKSQTEVVVQSEAEAVASTSLGNKVRKKKRKSSKSRGKRKLDKISTITEEAVIAATNNVGDEGEKGHSKELEISSEHLNNAEVSNKIKEPNRTEENGSSNEALESPNESWDQSCSQNENNYTEDDENKYVLMAEKVWAMQQVEKHNDLEWFESSAAKNYYTMHGGGLLKTFITKFKQLKKTKSQKEIQKIEGSG